jgi:hypothetical protein
VYGNDAPSLSSRFWLELDALPYVIRSQVKHIKANHPCCPLPIHPPTHCFP